MFVAKEILHCCMHDAMSINSAQVSLLLSGFSILYLCRTRKKGKLLTSTIPLHCTPYLMSEWTLSSGMRFISSYQFHVRPMLETSPSIGQAHPQPRSSARLGCITGSPETLWASFEDCETINCEYLSIIFELDFHSHYFNSEIRNFDISQASANLRYHSAGLSACSSSLGIFATILAQLNVHGRKFLYLFNSSFWDNQSSMDARDLFTPPNADLLSLQPNTAALLTLRYGTYPTKLQASYPSLASIASPVNLESHQPQTSHTFQLALISLSPILGRDAWAKLDRTWQERRG